MPERASQRSRNSQGLVVASVIASGRGERCAAHSPLTRFAERLRRPTLLQMRSS